MKNIQIILNAILSQDVFEYILLDRNYKINDLSDGIEKYFITVPKAGEDILDYLPELVGYESQIDAIFDSEDLRCTLETINKNNHYINLHVEHYSSDTTMILLHNITEITLSKLELLQYSNENMLLYSAIQKILDSQNSLLFIAYNNTIHYANKKFMDYFGIKNMEQIKERPLHDFKFTSIHVKNFDDLYEYTKDEEQQISTGNDTFIVKATLIERAYKLFTLSNITELSSVNLALEDRVNLDPLTGIYRKQYFDKQLEEVLKREDDFSLVVIDIDNFKEINDTYGHLIGDEILQEFTTIIGNHLRQDDLFSRWGGEEFLILIKCHSREQTIEKVESLRKLIEDHQFDDTGHLTASFGLTISQSDDTIDTIFRRADEALYKAKSLGKNRVSFL